MCWIGAGFVDLGLDRFFGVIAARYFWGRRLMPGNGKGGIQGSSTALLTMRL
jgi:hypothetical protein